tara:strand:- start:891 stop:1229 length:339 start_codon:yes stop_codon:yes gene_type:complete
MFRTKILSSIIVFTILLIGTSIIKNQTRDLEKKISVLNKVNNLKENDLYESQLDFYYLTSPSMIEKRLNDLSLNDYFPMEHSNIFLNISSFTDLKKKIVNKKNQNEKKIQNK